MFRCMNATQSSVGAGLLAVPKLAIVPFTAVMREAMCK